MPSFLRRYAGVWLVVAILLSAMCACGGSSEVDDDSMARTMCQKFVRQSLKAPSTAKIPYGEQTVATLDNGHYIVTGPVDAENSFGAMLRQTYYCETHRKDGDMWVLDSLFLQ